MSTKITLIRHGQTDWNKQLLIQGHIDNPLNEVGKEQALQVSKKLKGYDHYDVIISSPLQRAYQTAIIIKKELNIKGDIIIDNNVIERDFGALEGEKVCEESYAKMASGKIEGLESISQIQKRSILAMQDIVNQYPNKNILIVTHSHFIKGLLSGIIKDFDFTTYLVNTCINRLIYQDNSFQVIEYNI